MSDLNTPERRDSDGEHVEESETLQIPEQEEQPEQKNLENSLQVTQGNCDVVTVELLYKLFQRLGVMNQNLMTVVVILDKRLPRLEQEEEPTEDSKEE